jgi:NarL family two-component system sensor histidine kinase YdfH
MHMAGVVRFDIVIVFFIYGLAFFSMGVLLLIEARRSPSVFNVRLLWPLAFFGLIHSVHEWLEMSLEVRSWFGLEFPAWLPWLRLGLLVASFSFLLLFGFQVLYLQKRQLTRHALAIGVGLLGLYILLLLLANFLWANGAPARWLEYADVFARYILAVPAAVLAAYALNWQGRQMSSNSHKNLGMSFRLAAVFFALYSLTQLVVMPLDIFPARYVNTTAFLNLTGFPIQILRAALAVGITVHSDHGRRAAAPVCSRTARTPGGTGAGATRPGGARSFAQRALTLYCNYPGRRTRPHCARAARRNRPIPGCSQLEPGDSAQVAT